jgi:uncharacterized membrane protein YesL
MAVGYLTRKVDASYRIKEECVYVVLLLSANLAYDYFTVVDMSAPLDLIVSYAVIMLMYYLYIALAIVVPLRNANIYHLKPVPRIALRVFKLFI